MTSCHKKPAGSLYGHQFINPTIQKWEFSFSLSKSCIQKKMKETGVPSPALDVVQIINLGIASHSAASFSLIHFKALGNSLLQSLRDECRYLWNSEAAVLLYNLVVAKLYSITYAFQISLQIRVCSSADLLTMKFLLKSAY